MYIGWKMDTKRMRILRKIQNDGIYILNVIGETVVVFVIYIGLIVCCGLLYENEIILNVANISGIIGVLIHTTMPLFIAFVIIPIMFGKFKKVMTLKDVGICVCMEKNSIIYKIVGGAIYGIVLFSLFQRCDLQEAETVGLLYAGVGICEEIFSRGIIFFKLKSRFSTIASVIISALIFAFVFHTAGGLYGNILIRFPIGIVLSLIYIRSKDLYTSMFLHSAYDMALYALAIS